jgi:hypothetical protein
VHEDVARMLVALRLSRLQIVTAGRAWPEGVLAEYEEAFRAGYAPDGARPVELDVFCLLVALDQWTALVQHLQGRSTAGWAGAGRPVRRVLTQGASHRVAAEVARLLDVLEVS